MDTPTPTAQPAETDQVAELIEKPVEPPIETTPDQAPSPLGRRLEDITGLMKSINQRLEELSTERRAQVSQKQWASLEEFKSAAGPKPIKVWQKSLFARTYFVDKDLDDAFHNVMKYCSIFNSHLNGLSGKLQCRGDSLSEEPQKKNPVLPDAAAPSANEPAFSETSSTPAEPATTETSTPAEAQQEQTACADEDIDSIKRSFTELIRAKINFDSQFLNFNVVVSKNCYSEEFRCLYEICSNSNDILERSSLSIDKSSTTAQLSGDNSAVSRRQKRKRLRTSPAEKSQRKRTRRQTRSVPSNDEVQIIDNVRPRRHRMLNE